MRVCGNCAAKMAHQIGRRARSAITCLSRRCFVHIPPRSRIADSYGVNAVEHEHTGGCVECLGGEKRGQRRTSVEGVERNEMTAVRSDAQTDWSNVSDAVAARVGCEGCG